MEEGRKVGNGEDDMIKHYTLHKNVNNTHHFIELRYATLKMLENMIDFFVEYEQ